MKINNKYITSLESFCLNFNFFEVWSKIDIFNRDMSPEKMTYTSTENHLRKKELYYIIKNPHKVEKLRFTEITTCKSNTYDMSFCITPALNSSTKSSTNEPNFISVRVSEDEKKIIESIDSIDIIKAVALFKFADKKISPEITGILMGHNDMDANEIILKRGEHINLGQIDTSHEINLKTKLIMVPENSPTYSKVGNLRLYPGQFTYGIFNHNNLICVCPIEAENSSYHLKFEKKDDIFFLIVTDKSTGLICCKYKNVKFFTLIGDNNFAIINGLRVECYHNEDLNNQLRQGINMISCPQFIEFTENTLHIVFQNGTKKSFKL